MSHATPYSYEAEQERTAREQALKPKFPPRSEMLKRIPPEFRGKTLDDYVTHNSHEEEAKAATKDLMGFIVLGEPMKESIPGLTIIGYPGLGKTLLACVVLNHAYHCRKSFDFMPVADFVEMGHTLIGYSQRGLNNLDDDEYYRYRDLEERRRQLIQVKVLVLDDFGKEYSRAGAQPGAASWAESEFDRIIRNRWNTGAGPTIITSNLFIEEWDSRYRESLSSFLHEATAICALRDRNDRRKW